MDNSRGRRGVRAVENICYTNLQMKCESTNMRIRKFVDSSKIR